MIEHVPDLVGWLLEIRDTLKEGAVFGLAIPDRRVTFDSYRNDSVIAEVLEAYIQARRRPSARKSSNRARSRATTRRGRFGGRMSTTAFPPQR